MDSARNRKEINMSEGKLEKEVDATEGSETIQSSSNGVSISKEDLRTLYNLLENCSLTNDNVKHRFSFYIPHLIENVYQYTVEIETKKRERMRKYIFYEFVSKNFPNFNIAYDGVQFAYSPQRLPFSKLQCKTKIIHPESKVEHEFMIAIQEEIDCEIPIRRCIEQYINNPEDAEQSRAVRAFDTIVRPEIKLHRSAEISRSFFVLAAGMSDFRAPSEYLRVIWKRFKTYNGVSSEAITAQASSSNPIFDFRTPFHYLQELWKYFNCKKGSQVTPQLFEIVDSEEIIALASSCYPNKKFIRNSIRRMNRIELLNAAEKSLEFQEIAKKYFPSKYELYLIIYPLNDVSRYLSIFGDSIKRIWWKNGSKMQDEAYSKLIAQFCGKSLIELKIGDHNISFNELSQFQMLERLYLSSVSLSEFGSVPLLPSLKILKLVHVRLMNFDWLLQNFPKLESISLWAIDGLNDEMLVEFQRQNPQLHKICLGSGSITSSILKDIGTRTPNIVKFKCDFKDDDELQANMLHLSGLPKLKILNIMCFESSISAKPLIESLANKRVPIEYLRINCSNDVMENLPLLNRLKTAYVFKCSQKALINSIGKIPNLEKIWICDVMAATVPGIVQVLKSTRKLDITLITNVLAISSNEYRSILTVAKRRRHNVSLSIRDAHIDVEEDVLGKNRRWLTIGHD